MLLQSKHALVFAASGAIASGVARKFATEGATVWLSARSGDALEPLADEIRANGGTAHVDTVDATDVDAVADYVSRAAKQAGHLDATFNGIGGRPSTLGYPALAASQPLGDFLLPMQHIVGSQFLTAREVGKHMARQGSGAIVMLSATLSGMAAAHMAGISAACGAVEAMTRSLAGEFGPAGVRVNCVRGSAMPETRTIQETGAGQAALGLESPIVPPPLGRPITVAETASTAAFLASDAASGMTGQIVTVCAGAFVG